MKKLFFALLLLATVARAETYSWTNREGTVHFTDSPGTIPAAYRSSAKTLEMDAIEPTPADKAISAAQSSQPAADNGSVAPQVDELKERMIQDEGVMALIRAMQNDPEMQALLSDPAILAAIQAGDIGTLTGNPDFMKLLNNPKVRAIEQKLQQNGQR